MTSNKYIGHVRFHQIKIIRPPSFSSPYLRDWHELQHQLCRLSSRHSSGSWYQKISPQHSGSSDNIKHWNFESLEYIIYLENTSHDPFLAPALEDSDDQSLTSFFKVETVGDAWDSLRMAVPLFLLIVFRAGVVRSESVHLMQQQY